MIKGEWLHINLICISLKIAALINANNELLSCFKSYDEMLEQHAVNEATVNSQSLHNRTTRKVIRQEKKCIYLFIVILG